VNWGNIEELTTTKKQQMRLNSVVQSTSLEESLPWCLLECVWVWRSRQTGVSKEHSKGNNRKKKCFSSDILRWWWEKI